MRWWSSWTCWGLLVKRSNNWLYTGRPGHWAWWLALWKRGRWTLLLPRCERRKDSGWCRVCWAAVSPEAHWSFVDVKSCRHSFGTHIIKLHTNKKSSTKRKVKVPDALIPCLILSLSFTAHREKCVFGKDGINHKDKDLWHSEGLQLLPYIQNPFENRVCDSLH